MVFLFNVAKNANANKINKNGQPNEQRKNKNNNIIRNKTREQLACTVR